MKKEKFTEGMSLLCEVYGKSPSTLFLKAYWLILKGLTEKEFEKAVIGILDNKTFNSMPTPAEIKDQIRGDEALEAWLLVCKMISQHGAYMSIIFPDPVIHSVIEAMGGWVQLCQTPTEEMKWKQKDFERLYPMMQGKNRHPEIITGIHERGIVDLNKNKQQINYNRDVKKIHSDNGLEKLYLE